MIREPARAARRPATVLIGPTSIAGWHLWKSRGARAVEVYCNPHARVAEAGLWRAVSLENGTAVGSLLKASSPDLVIYAGGVCDVGKCEADPDWARRINVGGVRAAMAALPEGCRLVYVSSDHVFGDGVRPFDETSPRAPISVYGRTRVEAEDLALARPGTLVVRFGVAIGGSADGRSGHLDWLRSRTLAGRPMTIAADEVRNVVSAPGLARRIWALAESAVTGVRHVVGRTTADRPTLARALNGRLNLGARFSVRPRAERPHPHLGRVELATAFRDALAEPLSEIEDELVMFMR